MVLLICLGDFVLFGFGGVCVVFVDGCVGVMGEGFGGDFLL